MFQRRRILFAAVATSVVLAGCSGEDIAESVIERQLEAEGGGDVDLDLSDGEIRVETEDGTFEMTTGDDGEVTIRSESADGETVVAEGDGDEFVVTDGEDTFVAGSGAELPDGFPTDFPLPDATLVSSARMGGDGQTTFTLVYEAPGSIVVERFEEMKAALTGSGYVVSFESSDGANLSAQLSDGTTDVFFSGGYDAADDFSRFGLTVGPAAG